MNSDPQTPRPIVEHSGPLAVDCPTCHMPAGVRCALILPVSVKMVPYHPDRASMARWARTPDAADEYIEASLSLYRAWLGSENLDK